jgi:hypothetical protein
MIAPCAVTAVRFLRTDLNILVGNIKGDVYMLRVETHSPLRVQLVKLVESMDRIWDVKVAAFESLSTWGMACQGRLFKVWKRKDIYRVMNDMEEEEKMKQIRELEYYLIDNYTITLNTREEKKSYLEFSSIEPYTMLIYTDNSLEILFRNYKEHMVNSSYLEYQNNKALRFPNLRKGELFRGPSYHWHAVG